MAKNRGTATNAEPKPRALVVNRIALYRSQLGLTNASSRNASEQANNKWPYREGKETTPGIARVIARALDRRPEAVFPAMADILNANSEAEARKPGKRAGFVVDDQAPAPTWHLVFDMVGAEDPFVYLVDPRDAQRISRRPSP